MSSRHLLLATLAAALAVLAPAAHAAPAYEPNDGIHQAFGPLHAGVDYDAAITSSGERDWYILYTSGPGQVELKVTADTGSPFMTLLDRDGKEMNSTGYVDPGEPKSLLYTSPGPGHYYVRLSALGASSQYTLRVTGPLGGGPRPGAAEITPNNNPDAGSAFGPLAGGKLYGGSIDARGEEDWFYFHTATPGAFDVAITSIAPSSAPFVALIDGSGDELSTTGYIDSDTIEHLRYTAAGPAKFLLRVTGLNPGSNYQLRIDPAGLITATPPPAARPKTVAPACRKARKARKGAQRRLKVARLKVRTAIVQRRAATTRASRRKAVRAQRRWKRQVAKRKAALRKTTRRVGVRCG